MNDLKTANLIFSTDGNSIEGTFTDEAGACLIIKGDSFNDCYDALKKTVLLMQRRNGIRNFDAKGEPVAECTVDPKDIAAVMAAPMVGW